ncbi:MAG: alpha/beta fold hydrolase, partial [Planctomycetota bacterium]
IDQGNAEIKLSDIQFSDDKLEFKATQIGAQYQGTLNNEQSTATGKFKQGALDVELTLENQGTEQVEAPRKELKYKLESAWVGKLQMGVMEPVMQFRVVKKEDGTQAAFFDSVTEGRTRFEATFTLSDSNIEFDVPSIRLKYSGELNEEKNQADGTWTQAGRSFPLKLEKKPEEFSDTKNTWENRPQRPQAPFPYKSEAVKFENENANVTLAGTLTIPKDGIKHPAVILISGSGPQDRDETLMGHKPFLVLADYLTRRGIAVLRYDDRGTAESTGDFGKATSEDFAEDALAAVKYLATRDDIDPARIGLAGHSEGGLIAPMVANQTERVSFAVLMAGPGIDGQQVLISQVEAMLRANGADEETIELEVAITTAAVITAADHGRSEKFGVKMKEELEKILATVPEDSRPEISKSIQANIAAQTATMKSPWMQFFLKHDPRPELRQLKVPVLAIIGSKDLQVVPNLNMPEIEKAFKEGGHQDYEIVTLESLNHLFQKCETGSISEYANIQETFNEKALQKIGDWIAKQTADR